MRENLGLAQKNNGGHALVSNAATTDHGRLQQTSRHLQMKKSSRCRPKDLMGTEEQSSKFRV